MIASHLIAGDLAGTDSGVCRACGSRGSGIAFERWVKPTFTDHDKLQPGDVVCAPCLFCFDDANTALAKKLGKAEPQKMRNYSHFVVDGEWIPLSKAHKKEMRRILTECTPSVAVIADSGQKHIVFRARPGWWQFEEKAMLPNVTVLRSLLVLVDELLAIGCSKAEILSGHFMQRSLLAGYQTLVRIDKFIAPMRGSLLLALAVFLAQREEKEKGE